MRIVVAGAEVLNQLAHMRKQLLNERKRIEGDLKKGQVRGCWIITQTDIANDRPVVSNICTKQSLYVLQHLHVSLCFDSMLQRQMSLHRNFSDQVSYFSHFTNN